MPRKPGVFTASLASGPLARKVNASSVAVPYGVDEFAIAGLTPRQAELVDAPCVAEALAVLECRVTEIHRPKTLDGGLSESIMVFGQVVGIHIDESIVRDGRIDMSAARPLGRLGYMDYCEVAEVFEMMRPARPNP